MTDNEYAKLLLSGDAEAILQHVLSEVIAKNIDDKIMYSATGKKKLLSFKDNRKENMDLTMRISDSLNQVLKETSIDTNFDDLDIHDNKISFTIRILDESRLINKEIKFVFDPNQQ